MKNQILKDLMVPLEEYACVGPEATLQEAVAILEESWQRGRGGKFKHRAILVLNPAGEVVGKISHWDLLQSLEPKYRQIGDLDRLSHFGLNVGFMKSMVDKEELWNDPWEFMCSRTANLLAKDAMRPLGPDDFVDEQDTLAHAVHLLVMGRKLSVLVRRGNKVVGILRIVDVCDSICERLKSCAI
ncbi:MAG: CBS domain-containing protein [Desulfarculaceae bacterium]|nr:CBS domain-containing protein [Desulfarculaceae bacterium]MCF8072409.1 CBS domain-containing protein [Desulfarculaceae bacterium]MCF8100330.1 CBS domain-containing protein [Desulfarculaceae bacterium]MCF8117555.1 CBS domain-containing protein [Desulfarculaceae bacterium]